MTDLISRKAAIDIIEDFPHGGVWNVESMEEMVYRIKQLPSAQPTEASCWGCNCPKMERLKEQKTFSEMVHLHDAETHSCDTISRKDTIDVDGLDEEIRCEMCKNPMHTNRGCDGNCKYDEKLYERIIQILNKRIKQLPPAQPERKTGKWIKLSPAGIYECSKCGKNVMTSDIEAYNFCHGCGADMRDEADG